jgi:aspartyl aminopeptidase
MEKKRVTKRKTVKAKDKLAYEPRLVWDSITPRERKKIFGFADEYKDFLGAVKTEREAVAFIKKAAIEKGFHEKVKSGDPGPMLNTFHDKSIALAIPGSAPIENGIHLIVSHIDAPRLDLKQRPLYEEVELTFFKTHYYGGIKKYQWLARPLAIHGRIIRSDGSILDITIGEDQHEPVFTILDLLPHLARKAQYDKKIDEAFVGEKLNLLIGSVPVKEKELKNRFKSAMLQYLNNTYGLIEEDLISAELEIVPAGSAKDVGLDRSLIGSYGQDDRACAYTSMRAIFDLKQAVNTAVVLFVDKEEIGSDGATSAKSKFIESVILNLLIKMGKKPSLFEVHKILSASRALSADGNAALDPDYQEVHEKGNAARIGYGGCLTKFTGHGGKYGANDANAEYVGWLRNLLNRNNICWQTGELGKVDEGGGGTVAKFLATYGMEIIDYGPPILSMHSPFEVTHKGDIYMTYKAFGTFLESSVE